MSAINALKRRFAPLGGPNDCVPRSDVVDALNKLPRISFGFEGSPDVIGMVPITVTPEMCGSQVAVIVGVEFKTDIGRQSAIQKQYQKIMNRRGGVYIVERDHKGIADRVLSAVRLRFISGGDQ